MKKLLGLITIAGTMLFIACGPTTEDSVMKTTDSELAVDSVAQFKADSIAAIVTNEWSKADSITAFHANKEINRDIKVKDIKTNIEVDSSILALRKDSISKNILHGNVLETEGTLVYYCPNRMLENTNNNVSVIIKKATMQDAIEQLEEKIAKTTGKPVKLIQRDITGSSIKIATKMKVELKYSEKDIETIYKPEYDDQIFDGTNDMNWDWIIKPLRVGTIQLSIIVSAYDEKNEKWVAVQTPPKIFNIKVQVDARGYFVKLWEFLEKNPEWLFIQVLFPLVTFFYGKRQGKKSHRKSKSSTHT